MTIQVSYDHIGFTATDDKGNTATSTHKEGKEKAIERCKALSANVKVSGKAYDIEPATDD